MANIGNWTAEKCVTVGAGNITLGGSIVGSARFSDSVPSGEVWYSILDGADREAGIGVFDGANTLIRDQITATLVNSVFNDSLPTPIVLSGDSVVSCTFNANAYRELLAHMDDTGNPHDVQASQVPYDPSDDPVTDLTTVQDAILDHGLSIEERVASLSGIQSGGVLIKSSPTQFTISAGQGAVFDSYSNPINTSTTLVDWLSLANIALDSVGDVGRTGIFITSAGNALQVTGEPTTADYRINIFLGFVYHLNGVITEVVSSPAVVKQSATDLYDIMREFSFIDGSDVKPVDNAASVWTESGDYLYPGIGWNVDATKPNSQDMVQEGDSTTPIEIHTMTQDGNLSLGTVTVIPEDFNASGGVLTALNGNDATIHRLYSLGTGKTAGERKFVLLYGQIQYNNATVAKESLILDDSFTVFPTELKSMDILSYICVSNNTADFSDPTNAWITTARANGVTTGSVDSFTARLAGFSITGIHDIFTGDLSTIVINSVYSINSAGVSNSPPDFQIFPDSDAFLYTNLKTVDDGFQKLIGVSSDASGLTWNRYKIAGVWSIWEIGPEVQAALDAAATAADRVQTGLDAAATAADRVQTGLDVIAADDSATDAALSAASIAGRIQPSRNGVLNQLAVDPDTGVQSGFSAAIYTGNGTSLAVNTGVDMDTGDLGGFVWIKGRSTTFNHRLFDTVRGVTGELSSNTTNDEAAEAQGVTSFDATGFTVGNHAGYNQNTSTYAAWSWQTTKKETGVTNRNKAYTSHYNPDLGFSIVGYVGDALAGHEIPHHLGVKPELSIFKNRDVAVGWNVQGRYIGNQANGDLIFLNETSVISNSAGALQVVTDTTVSVGTNQTQNGAAANLISYHFASVEGVSKIGKYIGTGAAGNYVECGFKPAFLLVKSLTAATGWILYDGSRGDGYLEPHTSNAEASLDSFDFVADGFVSKGVSVNQLNQEFLFMAYAESASGGAGSNTYTNTDYDYPLDADTLTIVQDTLIGFAQGFDSDSQIDSTELVGSGVTHELGAGFEDQHLYLFKDLAGGYGTTENRPLIGVTRDDADFWGVVSPLDASLRTTARHFAPESSTGVVSASSEDAAGVSYLAFNHDRNNIIPSSAWISASGGVVGWLQYKQTEKRILKSWRFKESDSATRTPKRFTIEGSNDGLDWVAIDSTYTASDYNGNGSQLWGDIQSTSANATAYLYHRINITANNGDANFTAIAEMEFNTILPSDYYLIGDGVMYNSSDVAIDRTYLAEFRTDSNGGIINSTLVNTPVAKQNLGETEIFENLTVHKEIKNPQVATAWVNFDGSQEPPLIRDSFNVADVVKTAEGTYKVIFENSLGLGRVPLISVWNTDNGGAGQAAGGSRGPTGGFVNGSSPQVTNNISIETRIGSTGAADGIITDLSGVYLTVFGGKD